MTYVTAERSSNGCERIFFNKKWKGKGRERDHDEEHEAAFQFKL